MDLESYNLKIVLILTVGFALASILGYLTQRCKLSPILGYLLAGYLIGPYSPGFVADMVISEQLAEIGVILMMFGVGLHFRWEDLMHVKGIAIPGAIGQTFCAALFGTVLIYSMGWSLTVGIIIGLAIGVASTVVLVRVLSDNELLTTPQGHIAVGWLIVEDILTVGVLLLLPTIAETVGGGQISLSAIASSIFFVLFKFAILTVLMFTLGRKFVTYVLYKIARTRSHELFTLTVLALTFVIATGSALVFGTSIALGAFIAGMVIGQTEVRHQASANALPMKDAFVVIFFLSVGMLFNPEVIVSHFILFIGVLSIILIVKPLAAFLIVTFLRYPFRTGLTVALALAQIGEFSFILAEEAIKLNVIPDEGYDLIVACALISISINPILFKSIEYLAEFLGDKTRLALSQQKGKLQGWDSSRRVVVVGFGPIGQSVTEEIEKIGCTPIIIDRNIDTITQLKAENRDAVYGDAEMPEILEIARIEEAALLVITIPTVVHAINIIETSRKLNPKIPILARCRYEAEQKLLRDQDVKFVCCEVESMKAFHESLLEVTELVSPL